MNDPTENTFTPPADAFDEPEAPVRLPATSARTTIVTLLRFEEFFRRHASAAAPAMATSSHNSGHTARMSRSARSASANGRNARKSPASPASIRRDQWVS